MRVRVLMCGLCGTDLELVRGYKGFRGVPGHEVVGVAKGKRVVMRINLGCGERECPECRGCGSDRGGEHCPRRRVLGIRDWRGGMAEEVLVPASHLISLPDEVSDLQAVFVEPLAAAMRILEQVRVEGNSRIAVVGGGRLGQLVLRVLLMRGVEVTVVVKHEMQKELALAAGPAVSVMMADSEEIHFRKTEFDIVIECSGSVSGMDTAIELVRPRGILVLKSTFHGKASVDLTQVVVKEIQLIGSRCGPMESAIRALQAGLVDLNPIISKSKLITLDTLARYMNGDRQTAPHAFKLILSFQGTE